MNTLTSVPTPRAAVEPPARFGDLIASEWIKLRSLRSTWWTIALGALFAIGSAAVAGLADYRNLAGSATHGQQPPDFLPFDAFPPSGYMTLMLVAGSAGAISVVSEYSSGLIRTTTVAVPARGSVVLAKATVTAALWTAVGTAVSFASFFVVQAILNGRHAGVGLTHPGVPRALVASVLVTPICALIGLGLGVLIRHSAATIAVCAFTLLMLPTVFSARRRWSADIQHAMVLTAWRRLIQNWQPQPGSLMLSATVPGSWVVYALWPLIAVALAVLVVRRRDV
ncbi:ABC transporter permease [Streptomyces sp. NPDC020192]|uniref:ABC transporter permease n=1 Tax=Streptomyces sp. NPDC020192 TaxID=3365066 RepID=UPI0037931699